MQILHKGGIIGQQRHEINCSLTYVLFVSINLQLLKNAPEECCFSFSAASSCFDASNHCLYPSTLSFEKPGMTPSPKVDPYAFINNSVTGITHSDVC